MNSFARVVVVCVAALALVVASGCGSDTKSSNDYVSAINKVQTDFANDVQKVGTSSAAGSDPAAAAKKTFTNLKAAIDKVIVDLKAVDPPDKVKDLHNQLIAEMNDFDTEVKAAGDSLNSADPTAIVKAQSKFATSASSLGTRISKTIGDINTKLQG
jgi:outer membrane murein-binding lipoprotein Lpp